MYFNLLRLVFIFCTYLLNIGICSLYTCVKRSAIAYEFVLISKMFEDSRTKYVIGTKLDLIKLI
ncbi:hypothetical protein QTP88_000298 [Uroleucon formosanum]